MLSYYKLEGQTPVAIESFMEWSLWMMSSGNTTVMVNELNDCIISTRFVGIDLNPGNSSNSQPMIFETLVMSGSLDGKKNLYPTWDEAIQGHLKICTQVSKLSNY